MKKIGILGAGVMGLCVAQKLKSAGYPVTAYDVSPNACAKAVSIGVPVAADIRGAVSDADVVLMYLPGPNEIASCVTGDSGVLNWIKPGAVIVDQSTVDPVTSQRMAQASRGKGVGYLDAPVLGRPSIIGSWTIVVGGGSDDLAKCRSVLEVLGETISHQGPSGSGNIVKLLNQLMFGAINAITAEVMAISEKLGIPPKKFYNTIAGSRAGTVSNLFKELGARISEERYDQPTFSVDLLEKDIKLGIEMARHYGAPPLLARTVEFLNEAAKSQGLGRLDTSVMWKCYFSIWGDEQKKP
jgi:3-hydroxyisobutyrate dehydrogenase